MSKALQGGGQPVEEQGGTRRDFLYLTAGAMGAIGTAAVVWPFIDSLNPAQDAVALASVEVDLSPVEVNQAITVMWRGKPIFIRHRDRAEIEAAEAADNDSMPDPEPDRQRIVQPPPNTPVAAATPDSDFLVVVGVCTHLGCIPLGQKPGQPRGDYGGWFCPCHGSHYDTSGRIRKGPAPKNLAVPPYNYLEEKQILIG